MQNQHVTSQGLTSLIQSASVITCHEQNGRGVGIVPFLSCVARALMIRHVITLCCNYNCV